MIRDILTPEAHADPYTWAAVLLAHAALGVALWYALHRAGSWRAAALVAALYAGWEAAQALASGVVLLADSVTDWAGVVLGALVAAALWSRTAAGPALAALAGILAAGWWSRDRRDPRG